MCVYMCVVCLYMMMDGTWRTQLSARVYVDQYLCRVVAYGVMCAVVMYNALVIFHYFD